MGPNVSDLTRKSLFFGYGDRWLRPMDYVTMPEELLSCCTPIQRQLLGEAKMRLGYYLPTDEDVPLRAGGRRDRPNAKPRERKASASRP